MRSDSSCALFFLNLSTCIDKQQSGVILGIVLFSGIWVAALAATEGLFRQSLPPGLRQVLETVDHINRAFVKRVASYLFGLEQGKILVITSEASTEQQWNGRIRYMEQTLERIVQEVRRDMKLELQQMTAQMEELKMVCASAYWVVSASARPRQSRGKAHVSVVAVPWLSCTGDAPSFCHVFF